MATDLEYFKLCRKTDPSYTVRDAIIEYLSGDLDEAMDVANQICDLNNDSDSRLLSDYEVYDIIEVMSPMDAFDMGRYSDDIVDGRYYRIDGYGHFEAVVPWDYAEDIIFDGYEYIVNGKCDISDDLQEVIDVFVYDDDEDDVRSESIKRNAPKKKATGKKPAKSQCVKRPRTSGKKPAKKTSQSNNRKPRTASKKPVKKTTSRRP